MSLFIQRALQLNTYCLYVGVFGHLPSQQGPVVERKSLLHCGDLRPHCIVNTVDAILTIRQTRLLSLHQVLKAAALRLLIRLLPPFSSPRSDTTSRDILLESNALREPSPSKFQIGSDYITLIYRTLTSYPPSLPLLVVSPPVLTAITRQETCNFKRSATMASLRRSTGKRADLHGKAFLSDRATSPSTTTESFTETEDEGKFVSDTARRVSRICLLALLACNAAVRGPLLIICAQVAFVSMLSILRIRPWAPCKCNPG